MNTQVIDLTSEESSSTQRLTSFEASTEAAAVTPDTSGDAALAERLARKESARAKPNGDAPDTSGDADLAAKLAGSGPADTSGDADLAAKLSGSGPADTSDDAALAARLAGQADRTAGDAAYAARLAARDARTEGDAALVRAPAPPLGDPRRGQVAAVVGRRHEVVVIAVVERDQLIGATQSLQTELEKAVDVPPGPPATRAHGSAHLKAHAGKPRVAYPAINCILTHSCAINLQNLIEYY